MDPVDLTCEKMITPCYAEILLRLLSPSDREPDVKKSHCGLEFAAGPLTASGRTPQYEIIRHVKRSHSRCRFCEGRRYHRDCPIEYFEAEPEHYESINSGEAELWHVNADHLCSRSTLALVSNAVQLYVSMRYEATFLEKTIFKECGVTDRNINLVGLDWIDEFNLIQFPDEKETCQTSTLEPTNAENLVRGCNQCLHVAEIPHPSIYIQSPKSDSPRTQL
ncbi:hypothetical protein ACTXT7_000935 [Hymenolepis weldensis]